ncbi:MAG: RNA-guided endonuclease TnpB family protein, partial [Steroidobacteraceae bacterium]
INAVCEQYAKSRRQKNRPFLRWRGRRSLGWVPMKGRDLKREGEAFRFAGNTFRVFHSRPLPDGKIKDGTNFSCDARGNWFLNIVVEVAAAEARPVRSGVGIDLGLRDFAALSNGEKIENPRLQRQLADKLASAQRAGKKRQATHIYARIGNARRDFHHKLSIRIVREFDYIAVGDVNAAGLAKTRLAKSVLDAGWSSFRSMLRYKATAHGAWYEEVDESFSTRDCSFCKSKTGPKSVADLGIRSWICSECGVLHDRNINLARNILFRSGHRTPAEGIPAL